MGGGKKGGELQKYGRKPKRKKGRKCKIIDVKEDS